MKNLITSVLTLLIVIFSSVSPVRAYDIRAYGFILGGANANVRHQIPETLSEVGTFDIEYKIAYVSSTTSTVQQVTPDYIYAEWTFNDSVKFKAETSFAAPVSGDSWCGVRDVRLVCNFPVSKQVGDYYQIHVVYTNTANCMCIVKFQTNFNGGKTYFINDAAPIPALKVKTFLPVVYK